MSLCVVIQKSMWKICSYFNDGHSQFLTSISFSLSLQFPKSNIKIWNLGPRLSLNTFTIALPSTNCRELRVMFSTRPTVALYWLSGGIQERVKGLLPGRDPCARVPGINLTDEVAWGRCLESIVSHVPALHKRCIS